MTSDRNRSASSPDFNADRLRNKQEEKESPQQGGLKANKFSFSKLFVPVSIPSVRSGSPSTAAWSSKVSSFVGALFNRSEEKEFSEIESFTVEDMSPGEAMVFSSPETVRAFSPMTIGFASVANSSTSSSPQETTLPRQGFFQAGEKDREHFVAALTTKLENARASGDPEEQIKKDIGRLSYFLNGDEVHDVATIQAFLGGAAEHILPILSQTIPNTATDIVVEGILKKAPVDTTHAELAMDQSKKGGTSISLSKKEGSPTFHIEIESIGTPNIFLKKVEHGGIADFEMLTLHEENEGASQTQLSAEGKQFISLEVTKNEPDHYSISCSKLVREYKVKTPDQQIA